MKILILRTASGKVNLNTYNLQEIGLAKALTRMGHSCDVAYFGGKEKDHWTKVSFDGNKEIQVLWLRGYALARGSIYPTLHKYINNYDMIQIGGYLGIVSCLLNRKYGYKVVNYQGPYYYKNNKGDILKAAVLDRVLLPFSKKKNMICMTKSSLAEQYLRNKGLEDVTTVGVGLDADNLIDESASAKDNEFVSKISNKKENEKYFLYIGVLEDRRNTLFLIDVFARIHNHNKDWKLIMIGRGSDDYTNAVMDKISEYGIGDSVYYEKKVEQKYMHFVYELADAFLLPTKYEIFGMVLLEAMYYGVPVFTTYNGGSSTLMNSENGVVIENNQPDFWASKIIEVVENEEMYQRISVNGAETIKNSYTWDKLAVKFLEVYKKRLEGNK
ncbi:MAG: glycosyltransferase family 4 protein [Lachnospiraceae bacterium]|nr:glycosyltransferase family 4 protein [Lachnospiraceae bacterium]